MGLKMFLLTLIAFCVKSAFIPGTNIALPDGTGTGINFGIPDLPDIPDCWSELRLCTWDVGCLGEYAADLLDCPWGSDNWQTCIDGVAVTNTNLQNLINCLEDYLASSLTTAEPLPQSTRSGNENKCTRDTLDCLGDIQCSEQYDQVSHDCTWGEMWEDPTLFANCLLQHSITAVPNTLSDWYECIEIEPQDLIPESFCHNELTVCYNDVNCLADVQGDGGILHTCPWSSTVPNTQSTQDWWKCFTDYTLQHKDDIPFLDWVHCVAGSFFPTAQSVDKCIDGDYYYCLSQEKAQFDGVEAEFTTVPSDDGQGGMQTWAIIVIIVAAILVCVSCVMLYRMFVTDQTEVIKTVSHDEEYPEKPHRSGSKIGMAELASKKASQPNNGMDYGNKYSIGFSMGSSNQSEGTRIYGIE